MYKSAENLLNSDRRSREDSLLNSSSEIREEEYVDDDIDSIEEEALLSPRKITRTLKELRRTILTAKFFSLLIWMCISVFWANYYIGTVEDQFSVYYGSDVAKQYVDMFNILLIIGTCSIPFYGMFIEKFGIGPAFILTSVCGILYALGNMIGNSAAWFYATFCFYALYRTFLFSSIFAYISSEYGFRFFGAISGILFLASSLVGLSQYSLVRFFDANYSALSQLQLVCIFFGISFPLYVTCSCWKSYSSSSLYKTIVEIKHDED
jgi:hypothetical protein